jgi:ATP-binding cassette subfamily B protein
MAKKIDVPITMNYYGHLMKLPFSFFGTRRTGEFMSRFSDTDKIRKAVSSATLAVMLDSITAIGCGILLYKISDKLFLIILGVLVVYFFITLLFRKPIKDINHELMENESQVNSYLKESIDGIETVKAYQLENNTINKTKNMYEELTDRYVKGSTIYSVRNSLVNFVHSAGVVSVLWIGSLLCGKGVLDIIDLLTVYYLMGMFIEPVENIINLQPEIQTAIVAAERLDDITESAVENNYALMSSTEEIKINNIEIKNIDFTYGNRMPVLEDINIKIPKGKKIAVIGESGCGKTTIAKLLLSFYDATNGMIEIDGKNISDIPKSVIRNRIAYISQNTFMFSDSILNNIILENDSINENDFENICEKCSIDEFVNKMPLGYLTNLEENGTNISGGQRQRIAIARALLKRPDVLIMDEATSNLDIATEREIIETVYNTDYDLTCVIIAHRLETIINCDYVYVMREGKIVKSGIPSDILEAV